ncbi:hypothetical protein OpiT1DRAFT_05609 [Opitutaceae bacterium TAV1]|nr:hypothetical protein OpiT1DRAFT_05609 [Opitutaceae bacterium TAV1]
MPEHVIQPNPGQERLILQNIGDLQTDRYGLSSATAEWWYYGNRPENQIDIFAQHPRWSFLNLDRRTIRHQGAYWLILGSFYGVDGSPDPLYQLDMSASQEPVETHPDFKTFGRSTNGAEFDETDNSFRGFTRRPKPTEAEYKTLDTPAKWDTWLASHPATNEIWIGVRDYLTPGAIWRKTWVTKHKPSLNEFNRIGCIDSPPGGPPTPSGRNWLYMSLTWDQKGKTYTCRQEWKLSGRRGWNEVLYRP